MSKKKKKETELSKVFSSDRLLCAKNEYLISYMKDEEQMLEMFYLYVLLYLLFLFTIQCQYNCQLICSCSFSMLSNQLNKRN